MVEDLDVPHLLPGHGHVLQEFEDGVRHILERTEVDALVVAREGGREGGREGSVVGFLFPWK